MTKSAHRTRRREAECREKQLNQPNLIAKLAEPQIESLVPPVVSGASNKLSILPSIPKTPYPGSIPKMTLFGSMNQQPIQPIIDITVIFLFFGYWVSAVFRQAATLDRDNNRQSQLLFSCLSAVRLSAVVTRNYHSPSSPLHGQYSMTLASENFHPFQQELFFLHRWQQNGLSSFQDRKFNPFCCSKKASQSAIEYI